MKTSDPINPEHYTRIPGVEAIEVTQHFNFNLGNVIKYVWRAGHKVPADQVEDLRKAIWYLDREISRLGALVPITVAPLLPPAPWNENPTTVFTQ